MPTKPLVFNAPKIHNQKSWKRRLTWFNPPNNGPRGNLFGPQLAPPGVAHYWGPVPLLCQEKGYKGLPHYSYTSARQWVVHYRRRANSAVILDTRYAVPISPGLNLRSCFAPCVEVSCKPGIPRGKAPVEFGLPR